MMQVNLQITTLNNHDASEFANYHLNHDAGEFSNYLFARSFHSLRRLSLIQIDNVNQQMTSLSYHLVTLTRPIWTTASKINMAKYQMTNLSSSLMKLIRSLNR